MIDFILSLLSFSVCLITGINIFFIIRKNTVKGPLFRGYFIAAFAIIFWNMGYTFMFYTHELSSVIVYYKFASIGWTVIPSTSVYFIYQLHNNFLGKKSKMILSMLIFLPYPFFQYLALKGNFLAHTFQRTDAGWVEFINFQSFWIALYLAITFFGYIFCIVLLLRILSRAKFNKHKMQAKIILFPVAIISTFTIIINLILPLLDVPRMPPIGHLFMGLWILFIGYSFLKYPMLNIKPEFIVNDLLIKMYDIVLLTDLNGVIKFVNPAISSVLGFDKKVLKGKSISSILLQSNNKNLQFKDIINHKVFEISFANSDGVSVPFSCVISLVNDVFNDPVGYLLFAHDIRNIKNLEVITEELKTHQRKLQDNYNIIENKNEIMQRELSLARLIQHNLIPDPIEDIPNVSFHGIYKPMFEIGGDLYDFIHFREENKIGIFISDVSGHGVAAALIGVMIKTLINTADTKRLSPENFLEYINREIIGQTNNNFITAFYGVYDHQNKTLTYSRSGHPFPFLIRNKKIHEIKSKGTFLGIFETIHIEKETISLEPGDKIIFYTDGLLEAENNQKECFEYNGLSKVLVENSHFNINTYVETIYSTLQRFTENDSFEDDICIVGMEIH